MFDLAGGHRNNRNVAQPRSIGEAQVCLGQKLLVVGVGEPFVYCQIIDKAGKRLRTSIINTRKNWVDQFCL
jgi:hypothetical protein